MKLLCFVKLSQESLSRFGKDFPEVELYDGYDQDNIERYLDKVEIIFGNCAVELIEKATRLKWLQIISAGSDVYESVLGKDILVTTSRGVHWLPIAEHLLMMMLNFSRQHQFFRNRQAHKIWDRRPDIPVLLSGQKVGIIGFGGIARTLTGLLKPFNMEINTVTRHPPSSLPEGVCRVWDMGHLDELLGCSDHIILCLPLTGSTKGLLDNNRLEKIKRGAFLYNISRGGIIDEQALVACLQKGIIGGAALDVFREEPLPPDSLLWEMDNVEITPHIAGHYNGLREETFRFFQANLRLFLDGRDLNNSVTNK